MKTLIYGFLMCQSMFCSLPCPWNVWDEKARDIMLLWLPIVGLEIGAIWFALEWLCVRFGLPLIIKGLILGVYPFLMTGFIHLDGYMDVTDAVKSCRSIERRREILKDSHVGSFAVIGCCLLMISQITMCIALPADSDFRALLFIPAVSRCCSIFAVLTLPKMSTSQYAASVKDKKILVPIALLITLMVICFFISGKYVAVLAAEVLAFCWALRGAYRSLEGMNGDVSGYSITISELAAIAVMVLL